MTFVSNPNATGRQWEQFTMGFPARQANFSGPGACTGGVMITIELAAQSAKKSYVGVDFTSLYRLEPILRLR